MILGRNPIPASKKEAVMILRKQGKTMRQIAREVGLSVGSCCRIVNGDIPLITQRDIVDAANILTNNKNERLTN